MGFDAGAFDGDLRVRGVMSRRALQPGFRVMEQEGVLNQWGHRVEEGDIVAIPPGGASWTDGSRAMSPTPSSTAPVGLVMEAGRGVRMAGRPRFWTEPAALLAAAEARGRLQARAAGLLQPAARHGRRRARAAPSPFLRDELLDGLLTALAEVKVEGARAGRARGTPPRIVRGAEDFLEQRRRPPGGADRGHLPAALNISRRTLYRAFHDLLDVSPKAYLRLKNMSAAASAAAGRGNATDHGDQAALDQGFWELGRVLGRHRAMFGEPVRDPARGPRRGAGGGPRR